MLLWLLTRLTYLAGEADGVKCIPIRMFSWSTIGGSGERDEDVKRGERGKHLTKRAGGGRDGGNANNFEEMTFLM